MAGTEGGEYQRCLRRASGERGPVEAGIAGQAGDMERQFAKEAGEMTLVAEGAGIAFGGAVDRRTRADQNGVLPAGRHLLGRAWRSTCSASGRSKPWKNNAMLKGLPDRSPRRTPGRPRPCPRPETPMLQLNLVQARLHGVSAPTIVLRTLSRLCPWMAAARPRSRSRSAALLTGIENSQWVTTSP